jgi:phosphohistidine phosphatase
MLTNIYILRHGIAVPHGTAGIPDSQRPLTPKGEARMKEVARGLDRLKLDLQRIVTSPLPRARRTAEIVARELELDDLLEESDALSAGAPPRAIRDWLATRSEERIMLVGHNPDFTDLVGLLLGLCASTLPFELKKGGIAALVGNPAGGFELDWFATPGLIRKLTD